MNLITLIVQRLLASVFTLLLVSLLIFFAMEVLPGDAASRVLGREATDAALEALRAKLQLDLPAPTRYLNWIVGVVFEGDFGNSLMSGRPVSDILWPRIINTAILAAFATCLYVPLALIPASIQAINRDRPVDHILSVITLALLSIPDFLLGTILIILFVLMVPLFPAVSIVQTGTTVPEFLRAITLPGVTLAIIMAVYAVRMLRDNLIEVLTSDYIRMAELKGMPRYHILLRHALPNALIPTLNITALNLAYVVGGVVIVEKLFSYPGFGGLLVDSLMLQDIPVVEAAVLASAFVYVVANLMADVAAVLLNPKLRAG
jgi:peptide/nickel transport system permease protein